MKYILCAMACLCLWGCSSDSAERLKIGVDASWYPLDFGEQNVYVNGFVDDMLLEMAWHKGVEWEKIPANSDSLLQGLQTKKYDAILTSLPPYIFNLAKYDFSQNFLDLGPVLIVGASSKYKEFLQIKEGMIGVVDEEFLSSLVHAQSMVRFRSYPGLVELLSAIDSGEVVGGVALEIAVRPYLRDFFAGALKIVGKPITHAGLHLVAMKGQNKELIDDFTQALEWFKKKKQRALLEKWSLTTSRSIE